MALIKSDFTDFLKNAGRSSIEGNRAPADKTAVSGSMAARERAEKEGRETQEFNDRLERDRKQQEKEDAAERKTWGPEVKTRLKQLLKEPKYRHYFDPDRTDPDNFGLEEDKLTDLDRKAIRYYYKAHDPEIKEPDISDEFYNKYEGEDRE